MEMPVVVAIAIAACLVLLLRLFAARQVAARRGRFVWLMFVPNLFVSVGFLWISIEVFASAPFVGILLAIVGVINFAVLVRLLTRLSRSVTSTGPQDLPTTAIEPLVDYVSTMMGLLLIGGLIAVVGLIVWGLSQAAH